MNKYELVNKCKTLEDLLNAVDQIAEIGLPTDRPEEVIEYVPVIELSGDRRVTTEDMKNRINLVYKEGFPFNNVTRNYGLRQQLMMIMYYDRVIDVIHAIEK